MKCLFVTCKNSPDYLSATIFDGLQEVLGESNVVDAVHSPWLHQSFLDAAYGTGPHPEVRMLTGSREGAYLDDGHENDFDLMVVNAAFTRDFKWDRVRSWATRLKPGGKVAFVEGWDAAWQVTPLEIPVHAYFRKEIKPGVSYHQEPHHLSFAMPARMFQPTDLPRPVDVFFAGNPRSCHPDRPVRWPMCKQVFSTRGMHHAVVSTVDMGGWEPYWEIMKKSKLALVPPGADDCESLRCYEAAAAGAIPILLCYPAYRREPWFPPETCFECGLEGLADCIDNALATNLTGRRAHLVEYAKKHHTTRSRAEKILEVLG